MQTRASPLISVHIPKTAGTAFGELLEGHYGARLLKDYADAPLGHGRAVRVATALCRSMVTPARLAGFDAVHGHFLPLKYRWTRGPVVTWLRDPAQRLMSRYQHFLRAGTTHPAPGLRPGMDFEAFVEVPRFQNTYSQYFAGFPLERVAFFGFTEDMDEGLARLEERLGLALGQARVANANPARAEAAYDIPAPLLRRIQALHRADYRLVEWARARERV